MKMDKSVRFPAMTAHYGPSSHKTNPDQLPHGRNEGQKSHLNISQNHSPGPGSPKPTQSGSGSNGKKGDM